MSLTDVRARLVSIIEAAKTSDDEIVYQYPTGQYVPPCWVIGDPIDVFYNQTLGNGVEVLWPITYVVGTQDREEAHRLLDLAREPDNPVRMALQAQATSRDPDNPWKAGSFAVERAGQPFPVGESGEQAPQLAIDFICRLYA